MGYRVHAAVKYVVEYGDGIFNNVTSDSLNELLFGLADEIYGNDDYSSEFSSNIELTTESANGVIRKLEEMSDKEYEEDYAVNYRAYDKERESNIVPKSEVIEGLKYLFDNAAKEDGYVHLCWF